MVFLLCPRAAIYSSEPVIRVRTQKPSPAPLGTLVWQVASCSLRQCKRAIYILYEVPNAETRAIETEL